MSDTSLFILFRSDTNGPSFQEAVQIINEMKSVRLVQQGTSGLLVEAPLVSMQLLKAKLDGWRYEGNLTVSP